MDVSHLFVVSVRATTEIYTVKIVGSVRCVEETMRNHRDATLSMPKLILPAIQINMFAGKFPQPEDNGISYLKIPLNYF